MKRLSAVILASLLSTLAGAGSPDAANTYVQPYPHSSGAALLPYCEKTDEVVSQLRCDYYVQGVADLATIPQQGIPLACIPRGQNRTQLMEIAVNFLKTVSPETLAKESAASLILQAFRTEFPCPKEEATEASKGGGTATLSKDVIDATKKTAGKAAD